MLFPVLKCQEHYGMCFSGRKESWKLWGCGESGEWNDQSCGAMAKGLGGVYWQSQVEEGGKLTLRLEEAVDMSFIISPWVEMKMWLEYTPRSKALFTSPLRCCLIWFLGSMPTWLPPMLVFFPWLLEPSTCYFYLITLPPPSVLPLVSPTLDLCSHGGLCPPSPTRKFSSVSP